MSNSFPCSVVLAAHGSLAESDSNRSLFELAEQVAASQIFSKVVPAFLQGEPNLSNVLGQLPAGDIVVVPVMTSEGYYLQNVVPDKLAENKNFDSFRVLMAEPIGLHPELASFVADRISMLMNLLQMKTDDTTIVVVGHGTRRNPNSGKSTEQLGFRVKEHLPEANIRVAFIDQDPSMMQIVGETSTPNMLVVPFLISRGPHTTIDVPAAFGLPTGPDIEFPLVDLVGDGIVVCDLPVGMYPEIADLCIELATDAMLGNSKLLTGDVSTRKQA